MPAVLFGSIRNREDGYQAIIIFIGFPIGCNRSNDLRQPESYLRTIWNRLLPAQAYARQGLDSARGEGLLPGENSPVFPHIVADISKPASIQTSGINPRRFDALLPTPAGDELTIQFAEAALAGETTRTAKCN